jgi:hypothetical protein
MRIPNGEGIFKGIGLRKWVPMEIDTKDINSINSLLRIYLGEKKMNNKTIMKGAGVLLLTAVLLLSATAVTANTNKITVMQPAMKAGHGASARGIVWDNDLTYENLLACQLDPTYGELGSCADDFQLTTTADVNGVHWIGGYWNGNPGATSWQITIYADAGTGPGAVLWGPTTFPYANCNEQFVEQVSASYYYSYDVVLDPAFTAQAGVKYWIGFQGQLTYPPQSGIAGHALVTLNEMNFKSTYFGYPNWVPGSTVFGVAYDLAFQLSSSGNPLACDAGGPYSGATGASISFSGSASGGTEPYTYAWTFGDGGTATGQNPTHTYTAAGTFTVTLTVTDAASGTATDTAVATITGPTIEIGTISGGLGIKAVIKNTGTVDATGVSWKIELTGGFVLFGKSKTGTANIPAGTEVTVKDFVFGFGKTTITVTADTVSKTATGTVILFFVTGVV